MAHLQTATPVQYDANAAPTITFASSVSSGSLITVTVKQHFGADPPRTISSVGDNVNSGSYSAGAQNTASSNVKIHQFYLVANATGTPTITVNLSGTGNGILCASVYDSAHTTLDATNSATGTGTAINPGSVTPSASALYITACGIGPQYDTVTVDGTYTQRSVYQGVNGAVPFHVYVGDIVGSTGASNPTTTLSTSREWVASTMTFISAATPTLPWAQTLL